MSKISKNSKIIWKLIKMKYIKFNQISKKFLIPIERIKNKLKKIFILRKKNKIF